eukprot:CFRG0749T1
MADMSEHTIHILSNPSFDEVREMAKKGNCIPIYASEQSDLLTPVSAFLKLGLDAKYGFLFESVSGGEHIGRYSFVGSNPYDIIESTGTDPLIAIEERLKNIKYVEVNGLPYLTGGAIGYVGFDCVHAFEPRTARPLKDDLKVPDSIFMLCDELVAFDRVNQIHKVMSHIRFEGDTIEEAQLKTLYDNAVNKIRAMVVRLRDEHTPKPPQGPISLDYTGTSNIGQSGYEAHVHSLKKHIKLGDIIQAVPSQRVSRPTDLHPFNIYRMLRTTNPSPYMFYMHLQDFQLVGASPEMLVKIIDGELETHPIAGTRKRGKTPAEDQALMEELLADKKEIAEHVMLVDLGRNDSNRVCEPDSVRVTSLMGIEKYSHVMHIVSKVKGMLRPECSIYDAFRSIFPAGTVSGAPKIRAIELIQEAESVKRHFYAGAVGWFSYRGDTDTCIALRTMMCQDGIAYLQAGGGIVHDSDPTAEYEETVHKMNGNDDALKRAEITATERPGHPSTDAGVSRAVISRFAGVIPVFGVCMGQQCIYEVFGGEVKFAGEIVHGKVSPVTHDGKGCFKGVSQGVNVTRYHSLSGDVAYVPETLEVTASTSEGVIMAVRHKTLCVEGVQFHPESILSEEGMSMFDNFLKYSAGTWADEPTFDYTPPIDVIATGDKAVRACLKHISEHPSSIPDKETLEIAFDHILADRATPAQISGLLMGLKMLGEDSRVMACLSERVLAKCVPCTLTNDDIVVDIVGTGGDGHDTFNVSTTAGIIVAGAGVKVAKHGNRSASSKCGSADVLETLGVNLYVSASQCGNIIDTVGYCFLFAPTFHPALKTVAPVRSQLGLKTVFNILGPMVNPCNPKHMVVGVYHPRIGRMMAESLLARGIVHGLVVCGRECLDEISISGPTDVWEIKDGQINERVVTPEDFGLPSHPISEVSGGGPSENAKLLQGIVDGTHNGPETDFVLLNAAALLVVAGKANSWKEGVQVARNAIKEGACKRVLDAYVEATRA